MPQPEQLPGPNADIWNWQLQGLCRGVDSSMFFHPDGERGRARMQREQRAKEMCRRCPVIEQCRSHALEVGEPYGVWGGLSESERDLLLKGDIGRCARHPPLGLISGSRFKRYLRQADPGGAQRRGRPLVSNRERVAAT